VPSNESTCIAERLFALGLIAFLPFATRTTGLAAAMYGNKAVEALKAGARNSTADAAELNKLRGHLADAHGHLDKTIAKMTAARDAVMMAKKHTAKLLGDRGQFDHGCDQSGDESAAKALGATSAHVELPADVRLRMLVHRGVTGICG
jgi:hypothetical protein